MKTFQWPLRAFLFFAFIQLVSCTKNFDTSATDSISLETSTDATVANESGCKLRRILHPSAYNGETLVSRVFTYNASGNPVSLVYTSGYPTANYYFTYDKKNRLRELLISFQKDDYDLFTELHRYGFGSNDQIVTDTVLRPDFDAGTDELIPYQIIGLTYDSQGRIVKENIRDLQTGTIRNPTYTYDIRGNLAVKGWKSSGYDNKVSIFRAHPLFQFIHRNYSKNNALPEAKYNSKGLPLAVTHLNDEFFGADAVDDESNINHVGIVKAVYDCE